MAAVNLVIPASETSPQGLIELRIKIVLITEEGFMLFLLEIVFFL